jgi:hypothetical protein
VVKRGMAGMGITFLPAPNSGKKSSDKENTNRKKSHRFSIQHIARGMWCMACDVSCLSLLLHLLL